MQSISLIENLGIKRLNHRDKLYNNYHRNVKKVAYKEYKQEEKSNDA